MSLFTADNELAYPGACEQKVFYLADAIKIAAEFEPIFAKLGMHLAVGGSCMYKGHSAKDMDIFIYPHNRDVVMKRWKILELLKSYGFNKVHKPGKEDATAVPDVLVTLRESDGARVDWFFLSR